MEVNDSQGVLERVAARDAQRKAELDKAVQERQAAAPEAESAAAFLGVWQPRCSKLDGQLAALLGEPQPDQERLQTSATELESLQQDLAAAAYYLPLYDSKQAQATLEGLLSQLSTLKSKARPKAKFTFGARAKPNQPPAATPTTPATASPETTSAPAGPAARDEDPGSSVPEVSGPEVSGQTIIMHNHELEGRDITLSHMRGCQIFLLGSPAALRLKHMHDCHLVSGPVSGASFLDGLRGCVIWLASRQVRIHSTHSSQVYLRVASRPIVEDCSAVSFAPWQPLAYEGSEAHLQAAQLDSDTGLWSQVQDFKWLRATPSPNWSTIPEINRQQPPQPPMDS